MNLSERLDNLRKIIKLDLGITHSDKFVLIKGIVGLDSDYDMYKVETHNHWLREYLLERRDYSIGDIKYEVLFNDAVLFSDPIENFDVYFKSKSGINKFNL